MLNSQMILLLKSLEYNLKNILETILIQIQMTKMNIEKNIAIVGLGQVGLYLYNELNLKKKEIEIKTGKKIKIVAISAKNKNKKRRFKIDKKIWLIGNFLSNWFNGVNK